MTSKWNMDQMVFGLDIGTRSIVGSVGYMEKDRFNVVAHYVKEHETRDMLDGQIHDIGRVSASIAKVKHELEKQLGAELKDVCIAAAGRVLKTVTVHVDYELPSDTTITGEHVYSLELMGVEDAYEKINSEQQKIKFYSVGYTVVKYYLNDYVIANLEGHKAEKIGVDVLATFLPEDVVEGLYTAVEGAGLQVANLTLEPIAAINIAIPQEYRLLNIALVDVGAGTSDISITKDGSIIAYGMIPMAGDEFTEILVSNYLVDFNTAENIKRASVKNRQITFNDVMGLKQKVSPKDVRAVYEPVVDKIAKEVSAKIKELNGDKSVSAVFVVGGGGKIFGFTDAIAKELNLPKERVALRGEEVLGSVDFADEEVKKDPLLVTPIGICKNYYNQNNNFIVIQVNGERVKLYDNDRLTVGDAVMQIGFPNQSLFAKRGKELNFTLNGEHRMIRGGLGEPAQIKVNDKEASINTPIKKNDRVKITDSTAGKEAECYIEQVIDSKNEIKINVNNKVVICPKIVRVGNEIKTSDYKIQENDDIEILDYYTVEQLVKFMDITIDNKIVSVNNKEAFSDEKIYENFEVSIVDDTDGDVNYDSFAALENDNESVEDNLTKDSGLTESNVESEEKIVDNNSITLDSNEETPTVNTNNSNEKVDNISVNITVNGTPVVMSGKNKYIFVDILDFYEFDTKVAKGTTLITKVNGEISTFYTDVSDGDVVDIYWEV